MWIPLSPHLNVPIAQFTRIRTTLSQRREKRDILVCAEESHSGFGGGESPLSRLAIGISMRREDGSGRVEDAPMMNRQVTEFGVSHVEFDETSEVSDEQHLIGLQGFVRSD